MLPNDVHVIDLRDKTGKNLRDGKRLKRSVGDVELPEVVVELGPELTEGGFPSHFLIWPAWSIPNQLRALFQNEVIIVPWHKIPHVTNVKTPLSP